MLSSSRTSTIRSADALAILIITITIDNIIRQLSIVIAYAIRLVSSPVVSVVAPDVIIILAPNQHKKSIHEYMQNCISGILYATIPSAFKNILYIASDTLVNFFSSKSSRTKDLTTLIPVRFSSTTSLRLSYILNTLSKYICDLLTII